MSACLRKRAPASRAGSIVVADRPNILAEIRKPGIGLAIWDRSIDPVLHRWLDQRPAGKLPSGRILAALPDLEAAMATLFPDSKAAADSAWLGLAADIRELTLWYSLIAETPVIDIRLEEITHDACWRYHRDNVRLRLVTTYLGPGTEIVPAAHAEQALAHQREYEGPRNALARGAVALFKGDQARGNAIVHRSPPIRQRGIRRLFLSLNAPSTASPNLWSKP
ncbi:MAG TPA: DUF1826 domain-containing protein [Bradyrhizobium sp.]|nr:DUF1826 domain-containing protein [Bradyrhizobium sp.]